MKYINLGKTQRTLLTIGCFIILLGAANIIYGQYKTDQYIVVLSQSTNTPIYELETLKLSQKYNSPNSYLDQITRIKTRIDLYNLAIIGGRYMLIIGGITLISAFILKRSPT